MVTHSSTLAWKIPWTEKPGRLQSMGSQRVGHDWATFPLSRISCKVPLTFYQTYHSNLIMSLQLHSVQFSSFAQSCSTLCNPMNRSTARPPCPSPTPGVHPNPCPLSQWCHPAISSSVIPFSSCPQSFPASGSLQMSQLFASGGQVLELQIQNQSYQWTPRADLL